MSNLTISILLYTTSLIPWGLSYVIKDRDAQLSLAILDMILTWGSYIYFGREFGWWVLVYMATNYAIGNILEALGLAGFDNLTDHRAKKAKERRLHKQFHDSLKDLAEKSGVRGDP